MTSQCCSVFCLSFFFLILNDSLSSCSLLYVNVRSCSTQCINTHLHAHIRSECHTHSNLLISSLSYLHPTSLYTPSCSFSSFFSRLLLTPSPHVPTPIHLWIIPVQLCIDDCFFILYYMLYCCVVNDKYASTLSLTPTHTSITDSLHFEQTNIAQTQPNNLEYALHLHSD